GLGLDRCSTLTVPSRVPAHDFGSVRARCWRQKFPSVGGRALSPVGGQRAPDRATLRYPPREHLGALPGRRCEPRSGRSLTPEVPFRANRLNSALQTSPYCVVAPGAT